MSLSRSKLIGFCRVSISMVSRCEVAPLLASVRSTVSSRTVARSTMSVSTPTSNVPASRAADTRASISSRNSSKIVFCNPIGNARMRLSQRWIGGRASTITPSVSASFSPLRFSKSPSVVLLSLPSHSRWNQVTSAALAYSLSRLSAGSNRFWPPVWRWPRVSAPRLSRRRAIVEVKRSSPLQLVVTGRNSGVVA